MARKPTTKPSTKPSTKLKAFDFERSLGELEELVEKMESGDLSLEDSLKHFERGVALTRACQQALSEAEQRVKVLVEKDAKEELAAFETGDSDAEP